MKMTDWGEFLQEIDNEWLNTGQINQLLTVGSAPCPHHLLGGVGFFAM